ncbi:MAG: GGDEF domain-containing protein [Solirubrobacteraceae bacterium]
MDWFRSRHDLDDERVLIGVTAGGLWLVGGLIAVVAQLMPGAHPVDWLLFCLLAGAVIVYGLISISGRFDWTRVTVAGHAAATAILVPAMGIFIWATGGQDSYVMPILVLALMHVAYFFRWQVSLPLAAELALVAGSPGLYEGAIREGAASRLAAFTCVAFVAVVVLRILKGRLIQAEAQQRAMATLDALTGLVNRRGFDDELQAAVAARGTAGEGRRDGDERPGFALLLFDLDRFKLVNDTKGHPAGDRLLRAVAATCAAVVREGDTLARIGGDEFAVIAPGAGVRGAERLAGELLDAVRRAGIDATVAWAVHPDDGATGEELLRAADRRLYDGKATLSV